MRALRLGIVLILTLVACGGGDAASGPSGSGNQPRVVATVALNQTTATLVPQATLQLIATPKDVGGATVGDAAVTWSSGAPGVATVGANGLVTAVAKGEASITATSAGKTASATVRVAEGALIGPNGGTVSLSNGAAKITIPPGALTTTLPISITPIASPPSASRVVAGTAYELGPSGTHFDQSVTLEFKYSNPDSLSDAYVIHRYENGHWMSLGGSANHATRTVTAQTSSFSAYAIGVAPLVYRIELGPKDAQVFVGSSLSLTAAVYDGEGLPMNLKIAWASDPEIAVSQSGIVTGIIPGGPFSVSAEVRQVVSCNPAPCEGPSPPVNEYVWTGRNSILVKVALVPIATVEVTPPSAKAVAGSIVSLLATLKDGSGLTIKPDFRTITWATSNASVAMVDGGIVRTVAPGTATITASVEGKSGSATITVTPSTATNVASIAMQPMNARVEVGGTIPLKATPFDASGAPIAGKTITWATLTPALGTISSTGVVTGVSVGDAAIFTASIDGVIEGTQLRVIPPVPLVVGTPVIGQSTSCLLRTNGSVWCWGRGVEGQLGNGTTTAGQVTPAPVSELSNITTLSAGNGFACAVAASGLASCWGANGNGQLGDGTTSRRLVPGGVAGNHAFTTITAGLSHACALDGSGAAWCWGAGGKTGDGTNVARSSPVAVAQAPSFTSIAATTANTCALTSGGAVWCWGFGSYGEAGSGSLAGGELAPAPITGGHVFTKIVGGGRHLCGLKANGEIWCWGENSQGELGDGTRTAKGAPVRVSSTQSFIDVAAGDGNTCAIAADHTAWCWGLRSGTSDQTLGENTAVTTPIPVYGGHQFSEITVGLAYACGRATDGIWCWGSSGNNGQLGTGDPINGVVQTLTPVKVVFPQ